MDAQVTLTVRQAAREALATIHAEQGDEQVVVLIDSDGGSGGSGAYLFTGHWVPPDWVPIAVVEGIPIHIAPTLLRSLRAGSVEIDVYDEDRPYEIDLRHPGLIVRVVCRPR